MASGLSLLLRDIKPSAPQLHPVWEPVSEQGRKRDRSLRGKARIKARKFANKA